MSDENTNSQSEDKDLPLNETDKSIEDKTLDDEIDDKNSSESETPDDKTTEPEVEQAPPEMVEIEKSRLEDLETVEVRVLEEIKLERANSINFRKRLEKQRDDFVQIASSKVLIKLLAVKEDIDRVVENGKEEIPETHYQGIAMLQQRISNIFDQEGVSLILVDVGKTVYNPLFHEAIMKQPNDDVPPNTILTLVNDGFQKGDRVLRAAKVIISESTEPFVTKEKEDEDVEFSEF